MTSVYAELALVALGAMLSPTTLSFSVLALVLGDRPLRTGFWFYLGAFSATLVVGIVAAFVLGNTLTSHKSTPTTGVSIADIVLGVLLLVFVLRALRRPANPEKAASMIARMSKVASSPVVAIVGAGAALANPGAFIAVALKDISQTNPSAAAYIALWVGFTLVALLPLGVALVMLLVARERTERILNASRNWLERHARTVAGVILIVLAGVLLRNGISGLAG